MVRRFAEHRRWALRLFLAVSGVWFFRLALMSWLLINRGPVGFDPATFQGPALVIMAFAQTIVPLAVLELYFRAQSMRTAGLRASATAALLLSTAFTALGTFGATVGLWLPRL